MTVLDDIRKKVKLGDRFIIISEQVINKIIYSILLDSKTGVCYLQVVTNPNNIYGTGVSITPLLDSDSSSYKINLESLF